MGLDAAQNLIARETAKAKAAVPPPLNPEFPYVRMHFDPFVFGVGKPSPPRSGPKTDG